MDLIESLFYMIWRGLAIGILISAPMGPVGILCIQRTLDKGRRPGLYTGIGAAVSDLFYCLLTGFGLSFIEEFLTRNQNIIQLIGSFVLIGFGIYLFKKNPASTLRKPVGEEVVSPKKNILGGFLFTFSNPLILFLIIGLFARFNFPVADVRFYHYIVGFAAIFAGAVGWWWVVTYSVDKVRAHFNVRSMWLVNRVIGVVILIFAIVGIVTGCSAMMSAQTFPKGERAHWNAARGYAPFCHSSSEGIRLNDTTHIPLSDFCALESPADEFTLSFRSANRNCHPSKSYPYISGEGKVKREGNPCWGFYLTDISGDTLAITVCREEVADAFSSKSAVKITSRHTGRRGMVIDKTVHDGLDCHSGPNMWKIASTSGRVELLAGNRRLNDILTLDAFGPLTGFGFTAFPGADVRITDITLGFDKGVSPSRRTEWSDAQCLNDYLDASDDPLEGYWRMFDRTLEETRLRPGGDYGLAIVREQDGYAMLYLTGASVNKDYWKAGMVKGFLTPEPFPGIYNVEWIDAEGEPLANGVKAQMEDDILTIQFPYQSSVVRFRRVP